MELHLPFVQMFYSGPQGGQTAQGGLNVLRKIHIGQGTHAPREGGGQDEPVGLGLAGGRGNRPLQRSRYNGHVHVSFLST